MTDARAAAASIRLWAAVLLAVAAIPATVWLAVTLPDFTLTSALLVLLLEVVVVALLGNLTLSVLAALGAVSLANWYLVPPQQTFFVANTDDVIVLLIFLFSAVGASLAVTAVQRSRQAALRTEIEAESLRASVGTPVQEADPAVTLEQILRTYGLDWIRLEDAEGHVIATATDPAPPSEGAGADTQDLDLELPDGHRLLGAGPIWFGADRRAMTSLGMAAVRSHEARSLTEDARRAEALEAADQARTALLAGVGHDLRTPIAAITVAADALRSDPAPPPEDARELVDTIAESARRLDALVANLLDMSRLEAGRLMAHLTAVDPDEALAQAAVGQPTVTVSVPEDVPDMLADPGLLERVLANLVSNAVRHSPDAVTLSAARRDGSVRLSVADHGPGPSSLAPEDLFRPFQGSGDRSPAGIGLGLAIAKGFVTAMGGTIAAFPTPGGGLTVAVDLPVAP